MSWGERGPSYSTPDVAQVIMAFGDFSYPQVQHDLGLTLVEADLFAAVLPVSLHEGFLATLAEGARVALGFNTEKAKAEFIIAPILLEVRRQLAGAVGLFSGAEFNVDPARGLVGGCDFILSKAGLQTVLSAPVVTIVEVKNDNYRHALGQCIAEMFAAVLFNQQRGVSFHAMHGAVTTGSDWKFLRLEGTTLTLDNAEYYLANPGKIVGVLKHIIETA